MRFFWIAILCASVLLVSCTPASTVQPSQPLEFGIEPPEQKSVDFLQVLQHKSRAQSIIPRGITFSLGKPLIAVESISNVVPERYSPVSSAGVLTYSDNAFTFLQSVGEIRHIIQGSGSIIHAIASDNAGNYCIAGEEVINSYSGDILLRKFSASHELLWQKSIGGPNKDGGKAMTIDANGNVIIGGFFFSGTPVSNQQDGYLAKYNAQGELLWSKSIWSAGFDEVHSIGHDAAGNIFVAGIFTGATCNMDSIKLRGSGNSMFLVSYAPNGSLRWAKKADGIARTSSGGAEIGNPALSVASTGEIYVSGTLQNTLTLDNFTLTANRSMFLARYDPNGQVLWAKQSSGSSQSDGIVATAEGVVIAGRFNKQAEFDGFGVRGNNLNTFFIGCYGKNGNLRWLKRTGDAQKTESDASYYQRIGAVTTDNNGSIYVVGKHSGGIQIGSTLLQGGESIFLAKIGRK